MVKAEKFQQINDEMLKILDANMDKAKERRLAREAFKDIQHWIDHCLMKAEYNVVAYEDTARLWTALECIRTTQELEQRLKEVSLPLLILHGEADVITDPYVSKALFEKASSSDKMLRLFKDAYHSLLEGETDEMIFRVLDDIICWLDKQSTKKGKR